MAEPLSLSRSRREPRSAKRFEQEFGDGAQATSKKQIKQGYAASNRTASNTAPHRTRILCIGNEGNAVP